jgi:hypothetical protein
MQIVGREYIFKLMSPEFVESLFKIRKRYFLGGEPSKTSKGKTIYFVAKFMNSQIYKEYTLVGEGQITAGYRVSPGDRDYAFAMQNNWPYVIDFGSLKQYSKGILASHVFPDEIIKKLNSQRPFGVDPPREESKIVREKISNLMVQAD